MATKVKTVRVFQDPDQEYRFVWNAKAANYKVVDESSFSWRFRRSAIKNARKQYPDAEIVLVVQEAI